MTDHVIQVDGLSKRYRLGGAPAEQSFREMLAGTAGSLAQRITGRHRSGPDARELWALRDVNFAIRPGEVVGVIGSNGAGKSTLLKILCQITAPTSGRAAIHGRVASLLEVGTGFHPELSGRENIYLNGTILGMTRREIDARFDNIVEFSGITRFLDTPVKRYSSGMSVRLAFAVAAHLEPEILIIDEVLAVGDAAFQRKCLGKMQEVASGHGRTVLFVSHNMAAVRQLCTRGILLQEGRVAWDGSVGQCIDRYLQDRPASGRIVSHLEWCDPAIRLESIHVNGVETDEVHLAGETRRLEVDVRGHAAEPRHLGVEGLFADSNDMPLAYYSPRHTPGWMPQRVCGDFHVRGTVDLPALNQGRYFMTLYVTNPFVQKFAVLPRAVRLDAEGVAAASGTVLSYNRNAGWMVLTEPRPAAEGGLAGDPEIIIPTPKSHPGAPGPNPQSLRKVG